MSNNTILDPREHTLTCAFNSITDADCLAVVEALSFLHPSLFVSVVLEVRHGKRVVKSVYGVVQG